MLYLTPEERAVGQENFWAAVGADVKDSRGVNRRGFLKQALAAGVAAPAAFGAFCFGYEKSIREPVRVGVIGTGDQGGVLIGAINPEFIAVKAICDIRPYNLHRAFHGDASSPATLKVRCGLLAKYGWKSEQEGRKQVKVYADYRDLLADEQIEAVIVALPVHLHAQVAVAAMRGGKHVLVEKLMAQTVGQCKEVARTAVATRRCLAVGYQRHYNLLYEQAQELIAEGALGPVHYIRAQWHRGNLPGMDSWQAPLPPGSKPDDNSGDSLLGQLAIAKKRLTEAAGNDVALWEKRAAQLAAQIADKSVDAAKHGYVHKKIKDAAGLAFYEYTPLEELIRWRLWDRTGSGLIGELGGHQLSAIAILLSAAHEGNPCYPLCASGCSSRVLFPPDREVEDHVYATLAFPAPGYDPRDLHARRKTIGSQLAAINGNGFGGYGEVVFGTEAAMVLDRESEFMLTSSVGLPSSKLKRIAAAGRSVLKIEPGGDPESAEVGKKAAEAAAGRGYVQQLEHWAACVRDPAPEKQPRCNARVGLRHAVVTLVAGMAAREARTIEFKPEWFDPHSDETPEGAKPGGS